MLREDAFFSSRYRELNYGTKTKAKCSDERYFNLYFILFSNYLKHYYFDREKGSSTPRLTYKRASAPFRAGRNVKEGAEEKPVF